MGTFINQLIAGILANFKARSPKVWAAISLILGAIIYFAEQGTFLGVFELNDTWAKVVEIVSIVLGFLTGTPTTAFLPSNQRAPIIELRQKESAKVDAAA